MGQYQMGGDKTTVEVSHDISTEKKMIKVIILT